jgi:hypothetical protein
MDGEIVMNQKKFYDFAKVLFDNYMPLSYREKIVGTWLSLVEHSVRDAGVAGSNPVVPTIYFQIVTRFF